jgi:uncharacterized protein YjcR
LDFFQNNNNRLFLFNNLKQKQNNNIKKQVRHYYRMETNYQSKREYAKILYFQGWNVQDISKHIDTPYDTVIGWKRRDKWDQSDTITRINTCVEMRLCMLINKDPKDAHDFKEIDLLSRQLERTARITKYAETGVEKDLNPNRDMTDPTTGRDKRNRPKQNDITEEQAIALSEAFTDSLFEYQKVWHEAGKKHRTRNILKSRQVGATYFFAHEAFIDAVLNGNNQIFLSASKAQANVFRQYIIQFCKKVIDVDLKGDPIVLTNGATLYFLGTNSRTAQSYHGNLYIDEYFWIPKFQEFQKVASGMAMHKKWRKTYFSTPSAITHDAYPFWNGALFNKDKPKDKHTTVDVSHENLKEGKLCHDKQWRQILTVDDAIEGGCDLFDIDELKQEYSDEDYKNLLMCEFIDDTQSIFPLTELQKCMVDSWEEWTDFKPFGSRPYADNEVLIGYDPGLNGDGAGLIVLTKPTKANNKFRAIYKKRFKGLDFKEQSTEIEKLTKMFNVVFIGIDSTGIGAAVYENVKKFFPMAKKIIYNIEIKNNLVLKAKDVVKDNRLEFDSGWTDLSQSFLGIRRSLTDSGRSLTFTAGRNSMTGHSELAWATMHALSYEDITGQSQNSPRGSMEIF